MTNGPDFLPPPAGAPAGLTGVAAPPQATRRPLGADMKDLGEFLETCARGRQEISVNVPVQGSTQEDRLADLEAIARDWGVRIGMMGDGTRIAEKRFGRARVEAHVSPGDRTVTAWYARTGTARQAREAATAAVA